MERKRLSGIKRFVFSKQLVFSIRIIISVVFIYSGAVKFLNLHQFGNSINNYHILPLYLILPFASLITASEIVLGLLFLSGIYEIEAGFWLIVLNFIFISAMGSAIFRGINASCGCFSPDGEVLGFKDIFRDLFLVLLILWVIIGRRYGNIDN